MLEKSIKNKIKNAWTNELIKRKPILYKNHNGKLKRDKSKCLNIYDHILYLILINKDYNKMFSKKTRINIESVKKYTIFIAKSNIKNTKFYDSYLSDDEKYIVFDYLIKNL